MICHPNRILRKSRVIVAVRVRRRRPEILQIVMRDRVRISPQRRQRKSGLLRFKGKRIDFNNVKNIFAALLAGEKIIDPCDQRVAPKLE